MENQSRDTLPDAAPVKFDARLAEGVAYFEQMLDVMPDDRTTLEFLVVAYEQLGSPEKSFSSLLRLVRLLIKDREIELLQTWLPRLEASDDAQAQALALRVRTLLSPAPDLTPERPRELTPEERRAQFATSARETEMKTIDALEAARTLSPELAGSLREHLAAIPVDGRYFLISALQILERENPQLAEQVIAGWADDFGAPPVPLEAYDVDPQLAGAFPAEVLRIRGAVPFASAGDEVAVAVLNPTDASLATALSAGGRRCRLFTARPSAVEKALSVLFGAEEGA